jgi:hypothetical protein
MKCSENEREVCFIVSKRILMWFFTIIKKVLYNLQEFVCSRFGSIFVTHH